MKFLKNKNLNSIKFKLFLNSKLVINKDNFGPEIILIRKLLQKKNLQRCTKKINDKIHVKQKIVWAHRNGG